MEFDVFLPLDVKTSWFDFLVFPLETAVVRVFISCYIQDHRRGVLVDRQIWFQVLGDR